MPRYSYQLGLKRLLISATLLFSSVKAADERQCYFLNGGLAGLDRPCAPPEAGNATHCCNEADICLTNGLCYDQSTEGDVSRGSCADQSWNTDKCGGNICPHYNSDTGTTLVSCAPDGSEWCCSGDNKCVCGEKNQVHLDGPGQLFIPLRASQFGAYLATVRNSDGNDDNKPTGSKKSGGKKNPAKDSNPTGSAVPTASSSSSSDDMGAEIGLGVGLGVPLLLALGTIAFLVFTNIKLKKRSKTHQDDAALLVKEKDELRRQVDYWQKVKTFETRSPQQHYHEPMMVHQMSTNNEVREIDGREVDEMENTSPA